MRNKIKNNKAITLVALVITIVILLILAGITISQLSNSGIFEKVKTAKEQYTNSKEKEDIELDNYNNEINSYWTASREFSGSATLIAETESSSWVNITLLNNNKISDYKMFYLAVIRPSDGAIMNSNFFPIEIFKLGRILGSWTQWGSTYFDGYVKYINSDNEVSMSKGGNQTSKVQLFGIK